MLVLSTKPSRPAAIPFEEKAEVTLWGWNDRQLFPKTKSPFWKPTTGFKPLTFILTSGLILISLLLLILARRLHWNWFRYWYKILLAVLTWYWTQQKPASCRIQTEYLGKNEPAFFSAKPLHLTSSCEKKCCVIVEWEAANRFFN